MNREDVAIDVTIQDKHPEQAGGDERAAFEQWEAEQIAFVLRQIGSMDADDIDNDNVDLRFEDASGRDTGCDVSIVDYAEKAASLIEAMLSDRAALAQPSQSQYEASFEEWLANELEGEDGQPVPAAFCDIALARRAFNHWPKLEHPAKVGGVRFSAGVSSRLVVEAAQRLYEFESTPEKEAERIERLHAFREQCFEPLGAEFSKVLSENLVELSSEAKHEQAEAEAGRPEVVARVVHSNPVVLGQCGPLNANDELMTVAQHAASVARWAEMFNRVEQERDAALARVAELERQEPVATVAKVPGEDWNSLDFHRDLQDMQPGTKLYAAPVAQDQHSVPDGAADLCRFLAKLYCELDGLRYSTAKLPAEQIADALIFKWPVLQGARNQLNIKRISEQPYDESKLHSAIAAMLAAAPGKEEV